MSLRTQLKDKLHSQLVKLVEHRDPSQPSDVQADGDDRLNQCTLKNTKRFSLMGRRVRGKCLKVYDGDTPTLVFSPFPGSSPKKFRVRCARYNSAEIKSPNPLEKAEAIRQRDYLASRILNQIVIVDLLDFDNWGRILVEIYDLQGNNINDEMLRTGHGKPYNGTGKKNW